MVKKTILFAPAAYNLAETTRMLEIAKGIVNHNDAKDVFDIQFISEGGKFESLIEENGFPLHRVEPRLTNDKIEHIIAVNDEEKLAPAYSKQEMIEKIEGDVACLKHIKPAVVVTGAYLSMPPACRRLNIPLVWTVQSTWFEEFFASGAGMTDGLKPGLLKTTANIFLFWVIRAWMWYGFIHAVNQAAKHFNIPGYKPIFSYFRGDLTFVAEPPEFSGAKLPSNYHYIGPLIANQDFPMPEEIENIERDKPLIYFAMGSSGTPRIVKTIIESFEGKPYRVIAPVKSLIENVPDINIPSNVIVTDWLSALKVNKLADISVIHGGIGTVFTAAYAGKPVVGVGMQPEQVANISCLVRKGFAIRIPKSKKLAGRILVAIDNLLHDEEAKQKAAEFAKIMEKWDGPQNAAELLYQRFGNN